MTNRIAANENDTRDRGLKNSPALALFARRRTDWSISPALLLLCILAGCRSTAPKEKASLMPVPVTVAQATVQDVPVRLQAITLLAVLQAREARGALSQIAGSKACGHAEAEAALRALPAP